ncbi:TonB-dependent receptor [Pseudomonas sp. 5P_3.1_Bac2]|uniref:TonB-dependent receptor n=1 Tax=Pseudomonas sp. 5P_3.1_Bac2 TaxID=2971617 RepID=UPI0021C9B4E7|nr:TonB-dependent receptor [Pseudomonas sp. 5P_3.1_Bac2]MCU1717145.1 TonB-dependent receptor [Pseudomonas sp. 5P_3.1_Bac2]
MSQYRRHLPVMPELQRAAPRFTLNKTLAAVQMAMLLGLVGASLTVWAPQIQAEPAGAAGHMDKTFNVAAGSLSQVLKDFATAAGVQIQVDDSLLAGKSSLGLTGIYSVEAGFAQILRGQGLQASGSGNSFRVIAADSAAGADSAQAATAAGDLSLAAATVRGSAEQGIPEAYAGGQVASGSRVGILGNKDFMETPFNTISYTDEFIENRQAQDIGSVIGATDPSVFIPSKRSNYETFFMRGFNTTANDITYNGLVGMAPNMRGSTELAERVEVLKGPSALLNGMPPDGSVAGSINMVPKHAADEPLTRLTTTYESDGLGGLHADIGRRFGEDKQFGVRFNGVYRDGDTAVDDQQHKMQLQSLGLDWRGERGRISADMYNQRERMDGVNYFGISNIDKAVTHIPKPKKGDHSLAPKWGYTLNETQTLVLRGEYDLTDWVTVYGAWGQREGGYNGQMVQNTLLNNDGDMSVNAIRSIREGRQKSGEIGLRGTFSTGPVNHAWSLAANNFQSTWSFKDARYGGRARVNYWNLDYGNKPDTSGYGAKTQRTEAELTSFAMVDTLSFFDDRVQWTIGTRNQSVESKNMYYPKTSAPTKYDKSKVSPATALLVKVTDDVSLYANYIEGLSQGGTAPQTALNSGTMTSPFKTKQYEVGAKLDLGTFATTLSLFQIEKPSAYVDNETNIYGEYGEQRNRGVELSFFGEVTPAARLLGGISYTKAELTKALLEKDKDKQVTGVPKVMAKLGAEYDLSALPGLTLTGDVNYTDGRAVTNDHRLSLPSYTIFDVGVRYSTKIESKPVTLRAMVQNVADKAYWIGSWNGGDGSGLSGGLGAPRTYMFSASVDF